MLLGAAFRGPIILPPLNLPLILKLVLEERLFSDFAGNDLSR